MSVIDKIRAKAAADVKHVVLAEGSEPRTVQAAEKIVKLGLAKITLVGAKAEIEAKAAELGVDLTGVMIVDPATSEKTASYAEQLFHIREKKGMTLEKATELCLKNTLFYGTMMLKMGRDGRGRDQHHRRRAASCAADHQGRAGHQDRFFLLPDGSAGS